ncbi:4'-phosphopantetheinyl transferase superfamily protein [Microbulbifer agarilyticus]|uniref:4'-phosphopantetheinyl transferase family protein n=1 Tax=Microbulbifer agarilyticus TaxID=260552 RepID=UPI001C9782AE|nr:4'-phosphopantetheinyl transferase superfamily protein [Microbulbifer agarilyticus]MBY6211819.1 4'-phosphopantetheinyl transferase superfamily protein [Microbulbifer agarilyticus]
MSLTPEQQAPAKSSASALLRSGFILDPTCEHHDSAGFYQAGCRFDVDRYQPSLFAEAGILLPAQIARAVPQRQAEFLAGRYLAHSILGELHSPNREAPHIGIGEQRDPVWPKGVVGSITHCGSEAACVLASKARLRYLGIDRENWMTQNVYDEVVSSILDVDELTRLADVHLPSTQAATLIFSAKESLFKALYPTVQCYFGFECARLVSVDMDKRNLVLELREDFARRYQLQGGYLVSFRVLSVGIETLTLGRVANPQ